MDDDFVKSLHQEILENWGKKPQSGCASVDLSEKIKEIYYEAYQLYRDQRYEESAPFFRLLTLLDSQSPKFWKGLGACLQMQKNYEEAIRCYICTQLLNKDQPDPYVYIHAADCYFALNQKEQGLKALEAAKNCTIKKEDSKILKHVAFMRERWTH